MPTSLLSEKVGDEDGLRPDNHKIQETLINNNELNSKVNETIHGFQSNIASKHISSLNDITDDATVLQRFYSGASVFVTGATGFMGKVLIEKLLRSCPDIDSIYMMVREKKGRNMDERINDLVSSPCFDRIKREVPKFRSKLYAVAGDIGQENLGISDSDRHLLAQKVGIVFHVAATVRFDEHLTTAILQNVRATRDILNLCRTFKKLKSVIHVSTAYANCPSLQIDERFYEPPVASDKAIQIAEALDADMMSHLSQKILGKWPNSYAFTKAVSEDAVLKYGQGLPAGVFRPAIVVCTKSEPMAGWIDNMYGPTGVIVGVSSGLLRTMQVDRTTQANVVPCDMTINALIASAWDVAENRVAAQIPVYNYVSSSDNPVTWHDYNTMYVAHGVNWPLSQAIWHWTITTTPHRSLYLIYRLFLHFLPALFMDLFFVATNKSPQMIRMYQKIHKFTDVIAYFATTQWRFEDTNVASLWKKLDPRDQEIFDFDMRSIDWATFIKDSCQAIRVYLIKDPLDTLPSAKIRMRRLYVLHRFTQCLVVCAVSWLSLVALSAIVSSYSITSAHVDVGGQDGQTLKT